QMCVVIEREYARRERPVIHSNIIQLRGLQRDSPIAVGTRNILVPRGSRHLGIAVERLDLALSRLKPYLGVRLLVAAVDRRCAHKMEAIGPSSRGGSKSARVSAAVQCQQQRVPLVRVIVEIGKSTFPDVQKIIGRQKGTDGRHIELDEL